MKKVLIVMLATLAFYSCGNNAQKVGEEIEAAVDRIVDTHNARNALDYQGTYIGVLPAADAEGIETTIVLTDNEYSKTVKYLGKSETLPAQKGKYSWDKDGNIITLEGIETPNQYFVAENKLYALDINGQRITGDLAENYALKKQ